MAKILLAISVSVACALGVGGSGVGVAVGTHADRPRTANSRASNFFMSQPPCYKIPGQREIYRYSIAVHTEKQTRIRGFPRDDARGFGFTGIVQFAKCGFSARITKMIRGGAR